MKSIPNDVFTIKMTRALEDNVFATGTSIFEMMKIAGKVVAEEIHKLAEQTKKRKLVFLAGFGNNGGDALAAAQHLLEQNYECDFVLIGNKDKFNSAASQKNYERISKQKINWFYLKKSEDVESIILKYDSTYLLIDAIFGIGIRGEIREPYKSTIEFLNQNCKTDIFALDIPSGYDPIENNILYVRNAKKIVCLGRNKIQKGHFDDAEIVVRDIGIPEECEKYVGIGDLKWFYPRRKADSHKRQNGVVTIIAGSKDYIGAPALSGFGAFRTGSDLIFILTPENIRSTVSSFSPDFITIPAHTDEIEPQDIEKIFSHPRLKNTCFVIGPGMMNSETTKDTVLEFLKSKVRRQIIIDASALSMMEQDHLFLLKYHDSILTPHRGEFFTLFKEKLTGELESDSKIVSEVAKKWETTILLKGEVDIISNGLTTKFNKTGHPGMTVGGTGDVLTGIVASLLSVLGDPFLSACLAAYISGAAGELAAKNFGDGLMASDIPNFIYPIIYEALSFEAKEI
ncbi:MAG: NAD(P)H-hydrate dehydratase [Candidatus Heimdallarchaeota archaeon]|nr:NAD(P)H-hydrate dehydratase [Candidatus Heimdallarchaeota archaeon]